MRMIDTTYRTHLHRPSAPMVEVGDTAPDFTLADVDGQPLALSDVAARGQNALLVFLRHLG
jgi:peroxiredoxin